MSEELSGKIKGMIKQFGPLGEKSPMEEGWGFGEGGGISNGFSGG